MTSSAPLVKKPSLALVVATFFGSGYAPVASGTAGTIAALPLVWAVSYLAPTWQVLVAIAVTLLGIWAAAHAGRFLGVVDAKQIVIDEVAGMLVTMIAVPFTPVLAITGFVLFRLFDIFKPWPASYFDRKVKNGAGVVLDDIMAGLYARGCLAGLMALWPGFFS